MAEVLKERGFFWWFNEPPLPAHSKETSVPGLLTITDQGQITLEIDGSLCLKDEYQDWSKSRSLPESRRMEGLLAGKADYVLLERIERTDFSLPDDLPQQQSFSAETCIRRDSPFPDIFNEDNFTELRIELDGFEEWLGLESIVVDREYSSGEQVNVQLKYREWNLEYRVNGGTLSIQSITTGAPIFAFSDHPTRDAHFEQSYYLVFRPDLPSTVASLRYTYTKLEELLALLTGAYKRFASPILVSTEEFDVWNTLYFQRGASPDQQLNRLSIWLPFDSIRTVLGELFNNWIKGSDSFGAGYYLYVSSLRNPHYYSEDRFVNLVWGVEALHRMWLAEPETSERVLKVRVRVERILSVITDDADRKWLEKKLAHAHEPSLEMRILECFRKLPFTFGPSELEKFAKRCADRRNDISHAGGPRDGMDYGAFSSQISRLAEALDHLFHALLLSHIGVEAATVLYVITGRFISEHIKATLADVGLTINAPARDLKQE